jgi:hypothetical protein
MTIICPGNRPNPAIAAVTAGFVEGRADDKGAFGGGEGWERHVFLID